MKTILRPATRTCCFAALIASVLSGAAQNKSPAQPGGGEASILETEGTVEFSPRDSGRWYRASSNQVLYAGDRLRTLERSRAVVYVPKFGPQRLGALGVLEMPAENRGGFSLLRGIIYFFHRDKPGAVRIQTPNGSTLIRGTEFTLRVHDDGNGQTNTTLTLWDGEVEMTNDFGRITLASGEQGLMESGAAPRKTAVLFAANTTQRANLIQWALYYPAVLDVAELNLDASVQEALSDALAAYRQGDLLRALEQYPADRQPASNEERIFLAALLLSVGQSEETEKHLGALSVDLPNRPAKLAGALRELMAAVKFDKARGTGVNELATGWLAESYARQSRADLPGALEAARKAVEKSPEFGFAWARVAELEFSFGRVAAAKAALEKGLTLSQRNAQAVALKGFLLAAENKISRAVEAFNESIALDGALGNAWLGRGLCRIRQGDAREGLRDLEVAATLEPNRAVLRSYLGKGLSDAGDDRHATNELAIAKRLDPNDPTAWLYSALLNEQRNRINEAVRDLEKSQELNENRGLYRSRLLLDQDRAVRGANLANIYLDAGLVDVSTREAARAVASDYGNYSAHLFLANSYNALRDPRQIDLRYETPWLNEYLMANLLAPVGAGILSPVITEQEYSKLFERDRFGLASATEYSSRGSWSQAAAQYGTDRNSSYSVEEFYRSEKGDHFNNDFEQLSLSLRLKHEITPSDRLYGQLIYYEAESGDVAQHFDPRSTNPTLRVKETQEPIALLGYDHEWGPGSHTLLMAARLHDTLRVVNRQQQTFVFDREFGEVIPAIFDQRYRSELEIYAIEGQQILQRENHTFIAGARFQTGSIDTKNIESNPRALDVEDDEELPLFGDSQDVSSNFQRFNTYAYDHWRIAEPLLLFVGITYDRLRFPENFRFGPVSAREDTKDQVSPKGGFIWTPLAHTTFRGAYSRSLGGVGFDQSFQLEPSQVAGFNQAYRSLIPESAAGSVTAARFEMAGLSLEQKFGRGTYAGLSGEWLESDAARAIGVFEFRPLFAVSSTRQSLDYRERSVVFSLYQLLGDEWSLGLRYRFSVAELNSRFPEIPASASFNPRQELESALHQLNLFAIYNHPSGFFAQLDALWMTQSNDGYSPARPGDDFWQLNAFAGYRFYHRRAEVRVGLLNMTDQDYRLNPLNLTAYLPRERTLAVSMKFNF